MPEPVHDAVHVNVNAYAGFFERDYDYEIRGFASDAGQLHQFFDGLRDFSPEFFAQNQRKLRKVSRFVFVEPDGKNESFDFAHG